jgi:hypothetical protein
MADTGVRAGVDVPRAEMVVASSPERSRRAGLHAARRSEPDGVGLRYGTTDGGVLRVEKGMTAA